MSQEQAANSGVEPQNAELQARPEYYAEDLNQSKVHSVVSHSSSPQNLLKFFQQYKASNTQLNLAKLHSSPNLKLKKYKQSVFYGEFINGKRHGKGIMVYENNRTYEGTHEIYIGDWQNDYKHGQGYQKFPNQCVYQGDYINGKPEGVGRYSWPNGEFYEGQWINGMKQGSGMWRGAKGDSYIGQWKFGKADGYGVHTWVNGDRYQGQFKECLKHGQGIQKFANGDIYKGLYANGKPSGFGQYYWANGSYFKGLFKNGLRDGQGIWKRGPGNSDKYQGEYANDKKSGYGIFTWSTGNIYKGNYESDVRNGFGQMYWSDGSFYKGQWRNGIQHGQGQIYVPGQGYKKGMFQDNVLVIVQRQSEIVQDPNNYLQNNESHINENIQDPQKSTYKSLSKKNNKNNNHVPSKVSFRSRGYSSKNKQRQPKSIDENMVVRYGQTRELNTINQKTNSIYNNNNITAVNGNHPLLPNKFNRRQQKYMTIERRSLKPKVQTKQRILHSSFYMHKLHNRANTSINGSRADANSGYSGSQEHNRGKDMMEQMRYYNKSRANKQVRTPHI